MDLRFLAGDFLQECLPRDKLYLYKYFRTDLQRQFVRYIHTFAGQEHFVAHTGMPVSLRSLQEYRKKLHELEAAHWAAKSSMDLEALERIEKGQYDEVRRTRNGSSFPRGRSLRG